MPNVWLTKFVDDVAPHVSSWDGDVPLQCHVFRNCDGELDEWEVTLFGEPQTFGGRLKSVAFDAPLNVSVLHVAAVFEEVESCHWQTANIDGSDELGPHFSVIGVYEGHNVWLRILSRAPERLRKSARAIRAQSAE